MSKSEKFHLAAAILGVFVNIVSIFQWVGAKGSASSVDSESDFIFSVLIFVVITIYIWFSVSLFLIGKRRRCLMKKRQKPLEDDDYKTFSSVVGVGLLLSPFWAAPLIGIVGMKTGSVITGDALIGAGMIIFGLVYFAVSSFVSVIFDGLE
jgi:hypothetical protein